MILKTALHSFIILVRNPIFEVFKVLGEGRSSRAHLTVIEAHILFEVISIINIFIHSTIHGGNNVNLLGQRYRDDSYMSSY